MTRTGGHLGQDVAALADGELDHDRRDRALAHVAGCAECKSELDAERALKARLRHSACEPPAALTQRLLALGASADSSADDSLPVDNPAPAPGRAAPAPIAEPVAEPAVSAPALAVRSPASTAAPGLHRPRIRPAARRYRQHEAHRKAPASPAARVPRRTAVLAAGAMTLGGSTVGAALMLGAPPSATTSALTPPARTLAAPAGATGTAAGRVTTGEPAPSELRTMSLRGPQARGAGAVVPPAAAAAGVGGAGTAGRSADGAAGSGATPLLRRDAQPVLLRRPGAQPVMLRRAVPGVPTVLAAPSVLAVPPVLTAPAVLAAPTWPREPVGRSGWSFAELIAGPPELSPPRTAAAAGR